MYKKDKRLVTVHEIANYCGVKRTAILQRIKQLRNHKDSIINFLTEPHKRNTKMYFDKYSAKLIANSFSYKRDKSNDTKLLNDLVKSKDNTIKILQTELAFIKNENYYLIHYKK